MKLAFRVVTILLFLVPWRVHGRPQQSGCPSQGKSSALQVTRLVIDGIEFQDASNLPWREQEKIKKDLLARKFEQDETGRWKGEVEMILRQAWQDHGFFEAAFQLSVIETGGDDTLRHVWVTARVEEGLQFRLSRIRFVPVPTQDDSVLLRKRAEQLDSDSVEDFDFEGELLFSPEEHRKSFSMQDGEIFSVQKIRDGIDALARLYRAKGYLDFVAQPDTRIDRGARTVELSFEFYTGPQFKMDKLEILGGNPMLERNLRAILPTGKPFNYRAFEQVFIENKQFLPADWSMANVGVTRDVKAATASVVVDLRPQPCNTTQIPR